VMTLIVQGEDGQACARLLAEHAARLYQLLE